MHVDGTLTDHAGKDNCRNLDLYERYRQDIAAELSCAPRTPPPTRACSQTWSPLNILTLLSERSKTSPSSFQRIAEHLNNLEARTPTRGGRNIRPFTERDCLNKWAQLAPQVSDLRLAINFIKLLEKL